MRPLTRDEATERAALIAVRGYEIDLDLTTGPDMFRTRTRVRFDCRQPGKSTFVEHLVPMLHSVVLNGDPVDLAQALDDNRFTLTGLAAENDLLVEAEAAYSSSLEGLQRAVDPQDGETYIYSESFLDFAQRIFACFDQPDLKAPFSVSVTAPTGWTVLSNAQGREVEPGRWVFAPTQPLSTYLFALCAGPYHSATATHNGVRLGVWCRKSMAPYLEAEELLDVTRRGFDYYEPLFGRPYPFDKYDQIFLPDIGGAMENAGLVTYSDDFLFRSPVTDDRRRIRAEVQVHELAHMWFGDLVTMRWWDQIWLNESFATFLAFRTLTEATRHRTAWAAFALDDKEWGYRQDALPTTHPISADAPDTAAARLNMDGITYSKGAGVIKQLGAWVGVEAFDAGLRSYIAEHAFGNTTLGDLLTALEASSGRALTAWAAEWLQTAGISTLRPDLRIGPDGRYESAVIEQSAPPEHPTLRSHRIAIGLFDRAGERIVRRERFEVDLAGARTEMAALVGLPAADLLLINDDDLTWAKVRLDPRSLEQVRAGAIPRVDEPLARALLWMTVLDTMRDAEMSVGEAVRIILDGLANTHEIGATRFLLAGVREAIDFFGRPERRPERLVRLAGRAAELLAAAEPGSDAQLAFARAAIDAAADPASIARLRDWLGGRAIPAGLEIGHDQRWAMLIRLAVLGEVDRAEIDGECTRDLTTAGAEAGAAARASFPTAEAKADAWRVMMSADDTAIGMQRAIARGFWRPEHIDLTRPYLERYLVDTRGMFEGDSPTRAVSIGNRAFPITLVEPATLAAVDAVLGEDGLDPSFRRVLLERRHDVLRAQRTRERDVPG